MNTLLSVVVTNCDYTNSLPKLFATLDRQTFKNFEVVFIDDCSRESPWEILDYYSAKGMNIRSFYHTERQFNKNSILHGIVESRSPILSFIDADDFLINDSHFEIHTSLMLGTDADIVHFGTRIIDENGTELQTPWEEPCIKGAFYGADIYDRLTETKAGSTLCMGMCDKFYRRESYLPFIDFLSRSQARLASVDTLFNCLILPFTKKYIGTAMPVYGYVWTPRGSKKVRSSIYTMYCILTYVIPHIEALGCDSYIAAKMKLLAREKFANNIDTFCRYFSTTDRDGVNDNWLKELNQFHSTEDYIKCLLLGVRIANDIEKFYREEIKIMQGDKNERSTLAQQFSAKAYEKGPLAWRFGNFYLNHTAHSKDNKKLLAGLESIYINYMDELRQGQAWNIYDREEFDLSSPVYTIGKMLMRNYLKKDNLASFQKEQAAMEKEKPAWYIELKRLLINNN